ncbi:SMI1/KNR4 family protein [Luteimonas sp. WGS1318]|uniref:SMI1/KNR4 family protein n=1 Tax=Luteimonas sp. WGS1318 TaxID=3366815 RepID=UPI00372D8800
MDDISQHLISLLGSGEACGPATQEQIDVAQCKLGLIFPPSYRLFLQTFGAVFGHGFEIAGLTPGKDEPTIWCDMLSSTLMYRRHDALPKDSIYISTDGMDLSYFLKCSKVGPAQEGEVIEWGPDHDGGSIYAESFTSFLERHLDR